MDASRTAILEALVAVAWADGRLAESEKQVIERLIAGFGLSEEEASSLRRYAQAPRSLKDIHPSALSPEQRRLLLEHAVLLSFIDGDSSRSEAELIYRLVDLLQIPRAEAQLLIDEATERAKREVFLGRHAPATG